MWKPIERMVDQPIWVLKYDLFHKDGNFCGPNDGGQKFTDCHGWYDTEADALKALHHFPKPNTYRIERVWKREIIA